MDGRVAPRCYADVLYDDEICTSTAEYVALLDHSAMPHYLCGEHLARRLRDWPDSIVWMRNLSTDRTDRGG